MSIVDRLNITFIDTNPDVISALTFGTGGDELKGCNFKIGNILKETGTLYSPSNTIGNMDGGIDSLYEDRIPGIESTIMTYIHELYAGKMEIGQAQIICTNDTQFPYVVFSPTVNYPGDIATSKNVYESVFAAFREIVMFNKEAEIISRSDMKIKDLLIPGLGTGYGGLSPIDSAIAIRSAFRTARENL